MPYELALQVMDANADVSRETSDYAVLRLSPGAVTLQILTYEHHATSGNQQHGQSSRKSAPGVILNLRYRVFYQPPRLQVTRGSSLQNIPSAISQAITEPLVRTFLIDDHHAYVVIGKVKGYGGRASLAEYEEPLQVRQMRRTHRSRTLWTKYQELRKVSPMVDVGALIIANLLFALVAIIRQRSWTLF